MKLFRSMLLVGALAAAAVFAPAAGAATPQIATNYHQSCVLSDAGSVTCAGRRENSIFGAPTTGLVESFVPAPAFGAAVTQLAAGETHVCALLVGGTVQCWGNNENFQLGQDGVDKTDSATPLTVKTGPSAVLTDVTQLATQDETTCARKSDGTAWCWGEGDSGQIGDGGGVDRSLATQVSGLSGVQKVVGGGSSSCALITGGTAKCWGSDAYGQLGSGGGGDSPTPVDVQNLAGAADIGSGSGFHCALIADGTVKCWGVDGSGEQGNGPGNSENNTATTVPGLTGVAQLAVGYSTTCVLHVGRTVSCWGYNGEYEAAGPTTAHVESPSDVPGAAGALALAQQWDETACALYRGGSVRCWGINNYAQSGIANGRQDIKVPTQVPGLDLITIAYPGEGTTATQVGKTKLDKKKKTYTLTTQLSTTPNPLVAPSEACTGLASVEVTRTYYTKKTVKKKGKKVKKKVKKTKTYKKNGFLAPAADGNTCSVTLALKLSVKYFNGKKVKPKLNAVGNASLQPVASSLSVKLPKVKAKTKKSTKK